MKRLCLLTKKIRLTEKTFNCWALANKPYRVTVKEGHGV